MLLGFASHNFSYSIQKPKLLIVTLRILMRHAGHFLVREVKMLFSQALGLLIELNFQPPSWHFPLIQ